MSEYDPVTQTDGQVKIDTEIKKSRAAALLKTLGATLIAVVLAIFVITTFLAFTDYSSRSGLFGSEWVGTKWLERLFGMDVFQGIVSNTLVQRVFQLLAGIALALPLIIWIKISRTAGRALTKACVCLIPACLPTISLAWALIKLAPVELVMGNYYLSYAIVTALPTAGMLAFCTGLFEYMGRRGIGKGARTGFALGVLLMCLGLLAADFESSSVLQNAMNSKQAEHFDSYAVNIGLLKCQYSFAGAIWLVKAAVQLALGIIPAALISRLTRVDDTRIKLPEAKSSAIIVVFAIVVWVALVFIAAAAIYGPDKLQQDPESAIQAFTTAADNPTLAQSSIATAVVSALGGVIIGAAMLGLVTLLRGSRRGFGLIALLLTLGSSFAIGQFILLYKLGFMNTYFGLALYRLFDPRTLTIALIICAALRMAPERGTKGIAAGLGLTGAALAWGSWFNAYMFISRSSMYTLGFLMRNLVFSPVATGQQVTPEMLAQQQATHIYAALLVTLPALLLSALGALCLMRAFKKAE